MTNINMRPGSAETAHRVRQERGDTSDAAGAEAEHGGSLAADTTTGGLLGALSTASAHTNFRACRAWLLFGAIVALATVAASIWTIAAWMKSEPGEEVYALDRERGRMAQEVEPCKGGQAKHGPGSAVAVRLPDDSVLHLDYLDEDESGKGLGRLLVVRSSEGSTLQVIEANGGDFSSCDFNGDGFPDLFFVEGMGAQVVESSVLVYIETLRKFVPLELDGSDRVLQRIFEKLGEEPPGPREIFSNAEIENIDGVVAMRESSWGSSGGTILCWIVSGRRMTFAAGVKFGYEQKAVAVWTNTPSSPMPKYKSVALQRVYGSEYEEAVSGIDCSELMQDLENAPGREVELRPQRLPRVQGGSE